MLHRNRKALNIFLECETQWRVMPMGGLYGLDYDVVERTIRRRGIKAVNKTFDRIRIIERAALKELARKRQKHKPRTK